MKYTIGIGTIFDESTYNSIRDIELKLANDTGNFAGLGQPPHVTVKRPFDVSNVEDIQKCLSIMSDLAARTKAFELELSGIGNFSDSVLYLRPTYSESLIAIHDDLVTEVESIFPGSKTMREGDNMIFHSTLAMDLTARQFESAKQYLDSLTPEQLNFTARIKKVGLFLGIDNNTHWIVIAEEILQNPA